MGHALKAVQVPAGDLGDDVVQTGLKAGRGLLRYSVLDFRQGDAQSQFSSNKSQGIPVRHWPKSREQNQLNEQFPGQTTSRFWWSSLLCDQTNNARLRNRGTFRPQSPQGLCVWHDSCQEKKFVSVIIYLRPQVWERFIENGVHFEFWKTQTQLLRFSVFGTQCYSTSRTSRTVHSLHNMPYSMQKQSNIMGCSFLLVILSYLRKPWGESIFKSKSKLFFSTVFMNPLQLYIFINDVVLTTICYPTEELQDLFDVKQLLYCQINSLHLNQFHFISFNKNLHLLIDYSIARPDASLTLTFCFTMKNKML